MHSVGFGTPDAPLVMVAVPVLDPSVGDAHGKSSGHASELYAHQARHGWFCRIAEPVAANMISVTVLHQEAIAAYLLDDPTSAHTTIVVDHRHQHR